MPHKAIMNYSLGGIRTRLLMLVGFLVQDACSSVNLVKEGGAEVDEVSEGDAHFHRHPM